MPAFKIKSLKNPSFFQNLFGVKLKENGIIEINNLLARKNLKSIEIDDIQ